MLLLQRMNDYKLDLLLYFMRYCGIPVKNEDSMLEVISQEPARIKYILQVPDEDITGRYF